MGISPFKFSKSVYDDEPKVKVITKYIDKGKNPNPFVFIREKVVQIGRFTIAQVYYPDCTNYEGRKILMWHGHTVESINSLTVIDPHFSENINSPIARFEPTVRGWKMAEKIAKIGL